MDSMGDVDGSRLAIRGAGSGDAAPAGFLRTLRNQVAARTNNGFGMMVPEGMTEVIDEQARNLKTAAVVLAAFGGFGTVLVMMDFHDRFGFAGRLNGVAIITIYAAWIAMSYAGGGKPWFMGASVVLLSVQGCLWGCLAYRMGVASDSTQTMFVVGIYMALVSTPMLGTPIAIAMAFWLPVAIGTEVGVVEGIRPFDPYMAWLGFPAYEMFTLCGVIYLNRTLMERSLARMDAKAQGETVGLLLRDYQENASDWLWSTDRHGALKAVDGRFAEVLGSDWGRAEGRTLMQALGLDEDGTNGAAGIADAMAARTGFRDLCVKVRVDGEDRWWCLSGKPLVDAAGGHAGYRGVGSDVTEARRATDETAYLASHDPLTGLGNRRAFHDELSAACVVEAQDARGFALVMMDLDRFKEVNDTHGHAAGDLVLEIVGERIKRNTRPGDIIARLGGDEFALILRDTGPKEAGARSQRLIEAVSQRMRVDDTWMGVGASIGIAMFPVDGTTPDEVSRNADLALYRAKEEGRGNHKLFDPAFGEQFQDRVALLAELRTAIDGEALSVDYQPIVDMATGRTSSMEALCRWHHPARGAIPPSVFVPLAEECGLITRLGQQVLLEACRTAVGWEGDVGISVNLSPLQLKDPGLSHMVREVLDASGLAPERLELEVTESAWLRGDKYTREQLGHLEELGVHVVMDDFGSGFSSLSTLHSFRFHGLKVDAEFTSDIENDPKAAAIVRLVAELAITLGIELTAEGIETAGQYELIRSFGVSRAQGFLIGRPGPWLPDAGGPQPRRAA